MSNDNDSNINLNKIYFSEKSNVLQLNKDRIKLLNFRNNKNKDVKKDTSNQNTFNNVQTTYNNVSQEKSIKIDKLKQSSTTVTNNQNFKNKFNLNNLLASFIDIPQVKSKKIVGNEYFNISTPKK